MQISGTFLDEISHDIPHQNWGKEEWDKDFQHMKKMGIDTVILIRSGYRNYLTYPSQYLIRKGCFNPPVDLLQLFLDLSEKHQMQFYCGTYDSGEYWDSGKTEQELDVNLRIIEEIHRKYGHSPAFKGWYISLEISRKTKEAISVISKLGAQCKATSDGLPVLISPWIDGKKSVPATSKQLYKSTPVSLTTHEKEWAEIFDQIKDNVDIVAFQDGHVDLPELRDYLLVNKALADKFGLQSWTNTESFDRDMPIKFLPIKFEKLLYKLEAARAAKYEKAITFEFSHFMSPQSAYVQAHHLYNRYMEYYGNLLAT